MTDILFDVFTDEEGEPVLKGDDGISNIIVKFDRPRSEKQLARLNGIALRRSDKSGSARPPIGSWTRASLSGLKDSDANIERSS